MIEGTFQNLCPHGEIATQARDSQHTMHSPVAYSQMSVPWYILLCQSMIYGTSQKARDSQHTMHSPVAYSQISAP